MKKSSSLISIILIFAMVLSSFAMVFADEDESIETLDVKDGETLDFSDEGNQDTDPIKISSVEDFLKIAENPSGFYELTADLDFTGVDYKPFAFSGVLDGKEHYINCIAISGSTDKQTVMDANRKEYEAICSGLFTKLEGAAITNLKIYNEDVNEDGKDNSFFLGLVAGYAYDSTISNCTVQGKAYLSTSGHCFGIAGVIGFCGNCTIENCKVDAELVCIDTDKEYKDEQFLGGVYSFGYGNILNCNVAIYAYDSDHGYVHNGGLVGCFMYYDKQHVGEMKLLNNRVTGRIKFFEDNKDRRAYCEAYIGERMSWDYKWNGNTSNFVRDELKKYDENLGPDIVWEPSLVGKTDILLISSHADDEQLFFAGLLPYYSRVRKLAVQVIYVTDHAESSGRTQEREQGLWGVGITARPDYLRYYDNANTVNTKTDAATLKVMAQYGITEESFVEDLNQIILKYKPQVIVTHDINGEYGHGMHKLVNGMLRECLELHSKEYDFLKKVYFHLYEKNAIELVAIDEPSDELDGKTPFQLTQEFGFAAHKSQHWTWFYDWIYGNKGQITKAAEIATYSPLKFGLYFGDASLDVNKNDMFEGLKSYEQMEQERIEEERRLAEEARLREEEAQRKAEEERIAAELAAAKAKKIKIICAIAAVLIVVVVLIIVLKNKKKKAE